MNGHVGKLDKEKEALNGEINGENEKSKKEKRQRSKTYGLTCPTCKKISDVEVIDINQFPQNQYVLVFLKEKRSRLSPGPIMSPPPPYSSPLPQSEGSTAFSVDLMDLNHFVNFGKCSVHDQDLHFYCKDESCQKSVCKHCASGEHRGHLVVSVIQGQGQDLNQNMMERPDPPKYSPGVHLDSTHPGFPPDMKMMTLDQRLLKSYKKDGPLLQLEKTRIKLIDKFNKMFDEMKKDIETQPVNDIKLIEKELDTLDVMTTDLIEHDDFKAKLTNTDEILKGLTSEKFGKFLFFLSVIS